MAELQRQTLLIQLKILKELRLLNKNFANYKLAMIEPGKAGRRWVELNYEMNDVKEAIALTGHNFI